MFMDASESADVVRLAPHARPTGGRRESGKSSKPDPERALTKRPTVRQGEAPPGLRVDLVQVHILRGVVTTVPVWTRMTVPPPSGIVSHRITGGLAEVTVETATGQEVRTHRSNGDTFTRVS